MPRPRPCAGCGQVVPRPTFIDYTPVNDRSDPLDQTESTRPIWHEVCWAKATGLDPKATQREIDRHVQWSRVSPGFRWETVPDYDPKGRTET